MLVELGLVEQRYQAVLAVLRRGVDIPNGLVPGADRAMWVAYGPSVRRIPPAASR